MKNIRLTDNEAHNIVFYFYNQSFGLDDKSVFYVSDKEGFWNIWKVDINTKKHEQITFCKNIDEASPTLLKDTKHVFYFDYPFLKSTNANTKKTHCILKLPKFTKASILSLSNSGRFLVFSYRYEPRHLKRPKTENRKKIIEYRKKLCEFKPRCCMIVYDFKKKRKTKIFDKQVWIAHTQFCPTDDNTILYCYEGPEVEQRMWLINRNGSNNRPLGKQRKDRHVTHEFWALDGKSILYKSYKHSGSNPEIRQITKDGKREKLLFRSSISHFMITSDKRCIVGDNPKYITLFDLKRNKKYNLVRHNTSWKSDLAHPHPSFSRNNKFIIYTSDKKGKSNIYLIKL